MARHAREYGPAAEHECLAKLGAKGLYAKFSTHMPLSRTRYATTWSAANPEFEEKMAHVLLHIYREVEILKEANAKEPSDAVANPKNGSWLVWI